MSKVSFLNPAVVARTATRNSSGRNSGLMPSSLFTARRGDNTFVFSQINLSSPSIISEGILFPPLESNQNLWPESFRGQKVLNPFDISSEAKGHFQGVLNLFPFEDQVRVEAGAGVPDSNSNSFSLPLIRINGDDEVKALVRLQVQSALWAIALGRYPKHSTLSLRAGSSPETLRHDWIAIQNFSDEIVEDIFNSPKSLKSKYDLWRSLLFQADGKKVILDSDTDLNTHFSRIKTSYRNLSDVFDSSDLKFKIDFTGDKNQISARSFGKAEDYIGDPLPKEKIGNIDHQIEEYRLDEESPNIEPDPLDGTLIDNIINSIIEETPEEDGLLDQLIRDTIDRREESILDDIIDGSISIDDVLEDLEIPLIPESEEEGPVVDASPIPAEAIGEARLVEVGVTLGGNGHGGSGSGTKFDQVVRSILNWNTDRFVHGILVVDAGDLDKDAAILAIEEGLNRLENSDPQDRITAIVVNIDGEYFVGYPQYISQADQWTFDLEPEPIREPSIISDAVRRTLSLSPFSLYQSYRVEEFLPASLVAEGTGNDPEDVLYLKLNFRDYEIFQNLNDPKEKIEFLKKRSQFSGDIKSAPVLVIEINYGIRARGNSADYQYVVIDLGSKSRRPQFNFEVELIMVGDEVKFQIHENDSDFDPQIYSQIIGNWVQGVSEDFSGSRVLFSNNSFQPLYPQVWGEFLENIDGDSAVLETPIAEDLIQRIEQSGLLDLEQSIPVWENSTLGTLLRAVMEARPSVFDRRDIRNALQVLAELLDAYKVPFSMEDILGSLNFEGTIQTLNRSDASDYEEVVEYWRDKQTVIPYDQLSTREEELFREHAGRVEVHYDGNTFHLPFASDEPIDRYGLTFVCREGSWYLVYPDQVFDGSEDVERLRSGPQTYGSADDPILLDVRVPIFNPYQPQVHQLDSVRERIIRRSGSFSISPVVAALPDAEVMTAYNNVGAAIDIALLGVLTGSLGYTSQSTRNLLRRVIRPDQAASESGSIFMVRNTGSESVDQIYFIFTHREVYAAFYTAIHEAHARGYIDTVQVANILGRTAMIDAFFTANPNLIPSLNPADYDDLIEGLESRLPGVSHRDTNRLSYFILEHEISLEVIFDLIDACLNRGMDEKEIVSFLLEIVSNQFPVKGESLNRLMRSIIDIVNQTEAEIIGIGDFIEAALKDEWSISDIIAALLELSLLRLHSGLPGQETALRVAARIVDRVRVFEWEPIATLFFLRGYLDLFGENFDGLDIGYLATGEVFNDISDSGNYFEILLQVKAELLGVYFDDQGIDLSSVSPLPAYENIYEEIADLLSGRAALPEESRDYFRENFRLLDDFFALIESDGHLGVDFFPPYIFVQFIRNNLLFLLNSLLDPTTSLLHNALMIRGISGVAISQVFRAFYPTELLDIFLEGRGDVADIANRIADEYVRRVGSQGGSSGSTGGSSDPSSGSEGESQNFSPSMQGILGERGLTLADAGLYYDGLGNLEYRLGRSRMMDSFSRDPLVARASLGVGGLQLAGVGNEDEGFRLAGRSDVLDRVKANLDTQEAVAGEAGQTLSLSIFRDLETVLIAFHTRVCAEGYELTDEDRALARRYDALLNRIRAVHAKTRDRFSLVGLMISRIISSIAQLTPQMILNGIQDGLTLDLYGDSGVLVTRNEMMREVLDWTRNYQVPDSIIIHDRKDGSYHVEISPRHPVIDEETSSICAYLGISTSVTPLDNGRSVLRIHFEGIRRGPRLLGDSTVELDSTNNPVDRFLVLNGSRGDDFIRDFSLVVGNSAEVIRDDVLRVAGSRSNESGDLAQGYYDLATEVLGIDDAEDSEMMNQTAMRLLELSAEASLVQARASRDPDSKTRYYERARDSYARIFAYSDSDFQGDRAREGYIQTWLESAPTYRGGNLEALRRMLGSARALPVQIYAELAEATGDRFRERDEPQNAMIAYGLAHAYYQEADLGELGAVALRSYYRSWNQGMNLAAGRGDNDITAQMIENLYIHGLPYTEERLAGLLETQIDDDYPDLESVCDYYVQDSMRMWRDDNLSGRGERVVDDFADFLVTLHRIRSSQLTQGERQVDYRGASYRADTPGQARLGSELLGVLEEIYGEENIEVFRNPDGVSLPSGNLDHRLEDSDSIFDQTPGLEFAEATLHPIWIRLADFLNWEIRYNRDHSRVDIVFPSDSERDRFDSDPLRPIPPGGEKAFDMAASATGIPPEAPMTLDPTGALVLGGEASVPDGTPMMSGDDDGTSDMPNVIVGPWGNSSRPANPTPRVDPVSIPVVPAESKSEITAKEFNRFLDNGRLLEIAEAIQVAFASPSARLADHHRLRTQFRGLLDRNLMSLFGIRLSSDGSFDLVNQRRAIHDALQNFRDSGPRLNLIALCLLNLLIDLYNPISRSPDQIHILLIRIALLIINHSYFEPEDLLNQSEEAQRILGRIEDDFIAPIINNATSDTEDFIPSDFLSRWTQVRLNLSADLDRAVIQTRRRKLGDNLRSRQTRIRLDYDGKVSDADKKTGQQIFDSITRVFSTSRAFENLSGVLLGSDGVVVSGKLEEEMKKKIDAIGTSMATSVPGFTSRPTVDSILKYLRIYLFEVVLDPDQSFSSEAVRNATRTALIYLIDWLENQEAWTPAANDRELWIAIGMMRITGSGTIDDGDADLEGAMLLLAGSDNSDDDRSIGQWFQHGYARARVASIGLDGLMREVFESRPMAERGSLLVALFPEEPCDIQDYVDFLAHRPQGEKVLFDEFVIMKIFEHRGVVREEELVTLLEALGFQLDIGSINTMEDLGELFVQNRYGTHRSVNNSVVFLRDLYERLSPTSRQAQVILDLINKTQAAFKSSLQRLRRAYPAFQRDEAYVLEAIVLYLETLPSELDSFGIAINLFGFFDDEGERFEVLRSYYIYLDNERMERPNEETRKRSIRQIFNELNKDQNRNQRYARRILYRVIRDMIINSGDIFTVNDVMAGFDIDEEHRHLVISYLYVIIHREPNLIEDPAIREEIISNIERSSIPVPTFDDIDL